MVALHHRDLPEDLTYGELLNNVNVIKALNTGTLCPNGCPPLDSGIQYISCPVISIAGDPTPPKTNLTGS